MIDLHNHTPWCHHATGDPADMLRAAAAMGIREYGFSEHSPWMHQYPDDPIAPTEHEFQRYLSEMQMLLPLAHDLGVRLRIGIEMDYRPAHLETARAMADAFPFDHHIGAVHDLDGWIFDHPDRLGEWDTRDVDAVFDEYFAAVRAMLEWGLIDIVAHLDLPKKFGHRPSRALEDYAQALVKDLCAADVVVEINTAGRDKPAGEFYPGPETVKMLVAAGVPFTLGSDAHKLSEVGRHQHEALALLRDCGATEIITFDRRKRIGISI